MIGIGHTEGGGLVAGDINGDGNDDLVPGSVLGDFTGDGNLDLVTSGSLLYGQGDGTFSTPEPIGVWGGAAGDFNGDGWLDRPRSASGGVSVLINDQILAGAAPSLTIRDATVTEGHTGTVTASFEVTLSSNPTEPVTVNYTTADGSATTADGDYQSTSGTLTFNPGGPLTQTISGPGQRRPPRRDWRISSSSTSRAPMPRSSTARPRGRSSKTSRRFTSLSSPSVFEGNSGTTPLSFTVTLSAPYDAHVTVSFATQDGSATSADGDYQATSGTATIAAGATTTTVTINVNGDEKVEPDETFLVKLSNASSAYIPDSGSTDRHHPQRRLATKFYVVDASSDRTFEYDAHGPGGRELPPGAAGNNDPRGAASDASRRARVGDRQRRLRGRLRCRRQLVGLLEGQRAEHARRHRQQRHRYLDRRSRQRPRVPLCRGGQPHIGQHEPDQQLRPQQRQPRRQGHRNRRHAPVGRQRRQHQQGLQVHALGNAGGKLDDQRQRTRLPPASRSIRRIRPTSGSSMPAATRCSSTPPPPAAPAAASRRPRCSTSRRATPTRRASPIRRPRRLPRSAASAATTSQEARPSLFAELSAAAIETGGIVLPHAESSPTPSRDKPLPPASSSARAISPDRHWGETVNKSPVPGARSKTAADDDLDEAIVDAALAGYLAESPWDTSAGSTRNLPLECVS